MKQFEDGIVKTSPENIKSIKDILKRVGNGVQKIFEPFYMVDKSRNRPSKGVGLGLSICAQIAEIHKAKISVLSEIGKGTRIRVIFND